MLGGEIFVPKINSYKILDLAKAISKTTKIKVIGVRPGEKIHEEMISNADAKNTIEGKNCFIILPQSRDSNNKLKKNYLKKFKNFKIVKPDFSFTSNNNHFLSVTELNRLIKKNRIDFE